MASSEPVLLASGLRSRPSGAWSTDVDAEAAAAAQVQDRLTRLRMMYWPGIDGGVAIRARVQDGGKALIRRMAAVYGRPHGPVGVGGALCDCVVALVRAERHMREFAAVAASGTEAASPAPAEQQHSGKSDGAVARSNASTVDASASDPRTVNGSVPPVQKTARGHRHSGVEALATGTTDTASLPGSADTQPAATPSVSASPTYKGAPASIAATLDGSASPLPSPSGSGDPDAAASALARARGTWKVEMAVVGVSAVLEGLPGHAANRSAAEPDGKTKLSAEAGPAVDATPAVSLASAGSPASDQSDGQSPAVPAGSARAHQSQRAFTDDAAAVGGQGSGLRIRSRQDAAEKALLATHDSADVLGTENEHPTLEPASLDATAAPELPGADRLHSPEKPRRPSQPEAAAAAAAAISDSGTPSAALVSSRSRRNSPSVSSVSGRPRQASNHSLSGAPGPVGAADDARFDPHDPAIAGALHGSSGVRRGRVRSTAVLEPFELRQHESPDLVASTGAPAHSFTPAELDIGEAANPTAGAGRTRRSPSSSASAGLSRARGSDSFHGAATPQESYTPAGEPGLKPSDVQPAGKQGESAPPAVMQRARSRSLQRDGKGAIIAQTTPSGSPTAAASPAGVPGSSKLSATSPVSEIAAQPEEVGLPVVGNIPGPRRGSATASSSRSRGQPRRPGIPPSDDGSSSVFTYRDAVTHESSEHGGSCSSSNRPPHHHTRSSPQHRILHTSKAAAVLDKLRADARMLFRSLTALPRHCPCIPFMKQAIQDSLKNGLRPELFDFLACIAMEVQRKRFWHEFVASPEFTLLKQCLTLQRVTPAASAFLTLRILGRGGFGAVRACKKADTGRLYAMKVMDKRRVHAKRAESLVLNERAILAKARSPFVVGLRYAFQTASDLVLVQDLMVGGDLAFHISKAPDHCLDEGRARFYAAQLVLGLEHLHGQKIVYRDLKPDNVLMDATGNVALADLGLATVLPRSGVTSGRCGTRGYWAPEMIHKPAGVRQKYAYSVDWWSLGCVIYEMLHGVCPFRSAQAREYDPTDRHRSMDLATLHMSIGCDPRRASPAAQDLIAKLLIRDPDARLGVCGAEEVRAHPWFDDMDWGGLQFGQLEPPFAPAPTINAASQSAIGEFEEIGFAGVGVDQSMYEAWEATMPEAFQMEMAEFLLWQEYFGEPVVEPGFSSCCTVL